MPEKIYATLPGEVRVAIIYAKQDAKSTDPNVRALARLRVYGNRFGGPSDGPPLPQLSKGSVYREKDVGQAHPDDPTSPRGRRRLVFEVNHKSGKILEIFYTEHHYEKGSFFRII